MPVIEDLKQNLNQQPQQADLDFRGTSPAEEPSLAQPAPWAPPAMPSKGRQRLGLFLATLITATLVVLLILPIVTLAKTEGDVSIDDLQINEVTISLPPVVAPPEEEPEPVVVAAPSFRSDEDDTNDAARPASTREVPIPGQTQEPPPLVSQPIGDPTEPNLNIRFSLPHFGFEPGSNEPTAQAKEGLLIVAQYLKDNPQAVIVASHSDGAGDAGFNLTLSQARADLVRERLINIGVDADLVTAVGYGESVPIASNDTVEGRDANRRVEFVLVGNVLN